MSNILDHKVLTDLVRKFPPRNLIGMDLAGTRQVNTNTFEWDEIHLSKNLASFSNPDSEAQMVDPTVVKQRTGATASIREKKSLRGSTLSWLRQPGTEHTQRAMSAVRDEMEDLNRRVNKRVEWMIWNALSGTISYSSDNYEFNMDFNIPADHTTKPSGLSNGGVQWDNVASGTPAADLNEMVEKVEEDSNITPSRVYMPRQVMRYLVRNSDIRELIGEDALTEQTFRSGAIERLSGLDLIVYDAGYDDSSGTFNRFVGDKRIVMTPDPSDVDFLRLIEAPSVDPKANFNPGKFSKSWEGEDPPTVQVLIDYQVTPVLRLPEAIYTTQVLT